MSSDDDLPPSSQRAPRSKMTDSVTPVESESEPDDAEEGEKKVEHARLIVVCGNL